MNHCDASTNTFNACYESNQKYLLVIDNVMFAV